MSDCKRTPDIKDTSIPLTYRQSGDKILRRSDLKETSLTVLSPCSANCSSSFHNGIFVTFGSGSVKKNWRDCLHSGISKIARCIKYNFVLHKHNHRYIILFVGKKKYTKIVSNDPSHAQIILAIASTSAITNLIQETFCMNILLQLYAQIVTNKINNKKTYAFAFSFFVFFGVFVDLHQRYKNVMIQILKQLTTSLKQSPLIKCYLLEYKIKWQFKMRLVST